MSLKEEQLSAVAVYDGQDVLVCLPTGLPNATISKDILVVSPQVAFMEDQVYGVKKRDVRASILSSASSMTKKNRYKFILLCSEVLTIVNW